MKFFKKALKVLFAVIFVISCSDDNDTQLESTSSGDKDTQLESTPSGDKDILSLILEIDNVDYQTRITNSDVSNNDLFPFLTEQVKIKSFQVSSKASIDISIGKILNIDDSPFTIIVIAEDKSTKSYDLIITRDEGLQIEPNSNIENGSSYMLQSSDVYVDGSKLTQDNESSHYSAYADFNNDGSTDVLLSSGLFGGLGYYPIYLYLGDGTGINLDYCECGGECSGFVCDSFTEFPNALPSNYEGMQNPRKILTGDYNGDGKIDAFIMGHGYDADPFPGESPVLLLNNGNGFDYNKLNSVSGFFHGGSSADFDNDGDLDIFLTGGPTVFLINDGLGNFSQTSEYIDEEFLHNAYYTSEFIDVNSDGFIDLLIAGHEYEGANTYILWGNSSGKYFKDLSTMLPSVSGYGIVVDIDAYDIDNDGDKDIVLNRVDSNNFYENYYIQIIENTGNNNFIDVTSNSITNNSNTDWYVWLHLQDLNNDGNIDIYLERDHKPNLKWFNDGNGNFNQ